MSDQSSPETNHRSLNLFQKIIKIMEKVSYIEKGAEVSTGNNSKSYRAIQHDDVTNLLHGPCADMGIVVIPSITDAVVSEIVKQSEYKGVVEKKISYRADVWVDVTFINADNPDEKIVSKTFSYAMDSMDKATGKAYSMAVKYAYLKTFMLQSGDDEESRDWENRFNNNSNHGGNSGQNRNQNNNRNHSGNNGGNQTANNKGTNNVNSNNSSTNRNSSGNNAPNGQSNGGEKSDQKISQASDNQINAIKKISSQKGIEVSEKFSSKEKCSSQEAAEEIKRLSSIKN
jgi:hypothetical protein